MKFSTLFAVASFMVGYAAASDCQELYGYTYCDETTKFIYTNVGFSSSYQEVTNMDEDTGDVSWQTYSFSGSLSPFDEELSVHFRGPLRLSQFAVYYPASSSNSKRDDTEEDCSTTQHVHHKHVKRATAVVTETLYVNANGETITSQVTTSSTGAAEAYTGPAEANTEASTVADTETASTATASTADVSSSSSTASAGDWVRSSNYVPGTTTNATILNNYGGSGSGVWSSTFGNSLSYANSDNSGGASSATALDNVTIGSDSEFSIWSGVECGDDSEDSDCGYYRDGSVAYHGFSGAEKIFVFDFVMPSASSSGTNGDMPAIWLLNAKIPRTQQYGDASCWDSGCGELDLFEILHGSLDYLITTLHDKQGGSGDASGGIGSSDYITRPTDSNAKAVVIFYDGKIHVMTVDSDTSFDSTLSSSTVQDWINTSGVELTISS